MNILFRNISTARDLDRVIDKVRDRNLCLTPYSKAIMRTRIDFYGKIDLAYSGTSYRYSSIDYRLEWNEVIDMSQSQQVRVRSKRMNFKQWCSMSMVS